MSSPPSSTFIPSAHPLSHPDRLAAIAVMLGRNPAKVSDARILEIGCGTGNHLLPIALNHPHCKIVGIDTHKKAVNIGQQLVVELDLDNIDLLIEDFRSVRRKGKFDYIICHHLYSFLDDSAREQLLQVIGEALTENGLALISYAVYPGWKSKEILSELMRMHCDLHPRSDPLAIAAPTLDFYHSSLHSDNILKTIITQNRDLFRPENQAVLHQYYFDSPQVRPVYFRDFVNTAKKHELRFLCEAHYARHFQPPIGKEAWDLLQQECGKNYEVLDQCIDFFTDQSARQSVMVKSHGIGSAIRPRIQLDQNRLERLHIQGVFIFRIVNEQGHEPYWVSVVNDNILIKDNPLNSLIFLRINQHNIQSLALSDLLSEIKRTFGEAPRIFEHTMELITRLIELEAVQIRLHPVRQSVRIAKYPILKKHVRILLNYQKKYPDYCNLSSLWHQPIGLDDASLTILDALDGRHGLPELSAILKHLHQQKRICFYDQHHQEIIDDEVALNHACNQSVRDYLTQFSHWGLLADSTRKTTNKNSPLP